MIHDDPDRLPNRNAFYPRWAIATFALLVWQGDSPDSGGAAIMGVPLLHLVLPRATRGEARGHRSALAQNPLLMPPFFSFLWACRRSGVSSPHGGLVPLCFRCCGCFPVWFRSVAFPYGHVGRRRTHCTMTLVVCVLFVPGLVVWM